MNPAAPPLFKFVGLANAFGQGPPYFNAATITPATSLPQQLILEFAGLGSSNPFTYVGAAGLTVNLQDDTLVGTVHVVRTGPQTTDVMALPNPEPRSAHGHGRSQHSVEPAPVLRRQCVEKHQLLQ